MYFGVKTQKTASGHLWIPTLRAINFPHKGELQILDIIVPVKSKSGHIKKGMSQTMCRLLINFKERISKS